MKVLFLDIDGVCNSRETTERHGSFIGIDPALASRVELITLRTGCEVVLSSTWRHGAAGRKEVERKVCKLYGFTPMLGGGMRGAEVKAWLDQHPEVTRYAILDDDSDFYPEQPLFQTTWAHGLTEEIARDVVEHLNA